MISQKRGDKSIYIMLWIFRDEVEDTIILATDQEKINLVISIRLEHICLLCLKIFGVFFCR